MSFGFIGKIKGGRFFGTHCRTLTGGYCNSCLRSKHMNCLKNVLSCRWSSIILLQRKLMLIAVHPDRHLIF